MSRRPVIAVLGMTTLFVAACSGSCGPTTTRVWASRTDLRTDNGGHVLG